MELEGVVQNGVIVPEGGHALPEGTKVRIQTDGPQPSPGPSVWERLRQFAEECEQQPPDLPADYAVNHHHYRHGTPKRQ
jgi:hypothetical protein